MEGQYKAVPDCESCSRLSFDPSFPLNEKGQDNELSSCWIRLSSKIAILFTLTSILLVVVFVESFLLWDALSEAKRLEGYLTTPIGLSSARNLDRQLYLPTKYTSENRTEADSEWERIRTGHGVVALDKQWAIDRDILASVTFPDDKNKSLYVIEAYHVMHCIKNLRHHFMTLLDGEQMYWPLHHDLHCFDTLRQYVMCNADGTILYTTGHQDAGRGQTVSCRDWDALSQWAEERTTCYNDHEPTTEGPLFGICESGDGLPVGSLLGGI